MNDNLIEDGISGESILTCAARVAQTIENSEGFSEVMSQIAIRCAGAGLLEAAVELSELADDPYMREQALANIAAACLEFEEDDFAGELLEEIKDPGLHGVAMEQMTVKYAEAGAFDKALDLARDMEESNQALSRIALIYSDNENFDKALEVAHSIEDSGLKAATLIELAARNKRLGSNAQNTGELLLEATGIAEEIEFPQERINLLLDVASLYREIGREEVAYETLSRALKLCEDLTSAPYVGMAVDFEKNKTLANIAWRFAQLQRFDQAGQVIEKIDNPFLFAAAQVDVALEYHKASQSEQALTLLADALEVARNEEIYDEQTLMLRESLLSTLAPAYATVGHSEEALQVAGLTGSSDIQFRTLGEIARTCAQSGKHECIATAAGMIQNAYAKILFSIGVSDAFVEAEQAELADRTLYQALEDVEMIERPYEKALALMKIAARLAPRGQGTRASDLFFKALADIALIKGSYQKAHALIVLDDKHKQTGQSLGEREEKVLREITS